jgi:hypothetical protein
MPKGPLKVTKAHFRVDHHGSVCLIVPLSQPAVEWLDEHIGKENGYQPLWPSCLVEPRYLCDILTGIRRDGLTAL